MRKKSVILASSEDETKQAEIKRLKSVVRDLSREADERRLAIGLQTKQLTNVMVALQRAQGALNVLTNRGDIVP
jgi:hypothetical protein